MGRRIHLAAPGGGAACGAHSAGSTNDIREVLSSDHLALVDCRKCKATSQYQAAVNPTQYRLRLFTVHGNPVLAKSYAMAEKKRHIA